MNHMRTERILPGKNYNSFWPRTKFILSGEKKKISCPSMLRYFTKLNFSKIFFCPFLHAHLFGWNLLVTQQPTNDSCLGTT
nr:hypothetical protein Itr_chr02CG00680 [Ipomoea trifida]